MDTVTTNLPWPPEHPARPSMPPPAEVKSWVRSQVGRAVGYAVNVLDVIPRDVNEKRCAAWAADHYELTAFYASMGTRLDTLQAALDDLPGVYLSVIITGDPACVPASWPVKYRSSATLRPQVRALWRGATT